MSTNITKNHRLALKLGWKNIIDVNGSLLGMPPNGTSNSRGQALIPNWTGDNAAALLLMCENYAIPAEKFRMLIVNKALERLNFNSQN